MILFVSLLPTILPRYNLLHDLFPGLVSFRTYTWTRIVPKTVEPSYTSFQDRDQLQGVPNSWINNKAEILSEREPVH